MGRLPDHFKDARIVDVGDSSFVGTPNGSIKVAGLCDWAVESRAEDTPEVASGTASNTYWYVSAGLLELILQYATPPTTDGHHCPAAHGVKEI